MSLFTDYLITALASSSSKETPAYLELLTLNQMWGVRQYYDSILISEVCYLSDGIIQQTIGHIISVSENLYSSSTAFRLKVVVYSMSLVIHGCCVNVAG